MPPVRPGYGQKVVHLLEFLPTSRFHNPMALTSPRPPVLVLPKTQIIKTLYNTLVDDLVSYLYVFKCGGNYISSQIVVS